MARFTTVLLPSTVISSLLKLLSVEGACLVILNAYVLLDALLSDNDNVSRIVLYSDFITILNVLFVCDAAFVTVCAPAPVTVA